MADVTRTGLGEGIAVVDFGTGLAGGLVGRLLVDAGASVTRVVTGPDPFADLYPAYALWQRGKTVLAVEGLGDPAVAAALERADLCIIGGEDHPDAPPLPDAAAIAACFPRLVVLEIASDPTAPGRPGVDLLAQVRSGYCNEQFSTRPIAFAFPLAAYGAALHGLTAALAALCERQLSGRGQRVGTSLLEGATAWCAPHWFEAERPTPALLAEIPRDVQPLIFRCADGKYIHFMMGTPGAVARLYRILGIDDPTVDPNDRGMPTGRGEKKNFWGNIELIQHHIGRFTSDEALKALWGEGMGAERVEPPGACWSDPQVIHNAILARTETGERVVGMPIQHGPAPSAPVPPAEPVPGRGGPLAGLRVCDFGSFVAGPYLSVLLGDLGADVIKIEGLAGDVNRALFRAFACTNRGKRAISVDVKSPGGAEVARRLAGWADIVHHNFRPGVSAKLGLDAATLQRTRPEILVGETSGYGPDGPKAQHAGFDMLFQAFCGHEFRGAGEGDLPLWNRSAIVDFGGGLLTAIGVLLALLRRRRGEAPPGVFVNLLDTGIFLMSELVGLADGSFAGAPRMNAELTGAHPAERLYRLADDGWVAIAVRGSAMARRLAGALGIEGALGEDPTAWGEAEGDAIAAALAPRGVAETVSLLEGAGVWHEIAHADQRERALADAALQAGGVILRTDDPEFGDYRQIGPAFRFSRTPLALRGLGLTPRRGEHTREVLARLGYGEPEIAALVAEKAVA